MTDLAALAAAVRAAHDNPPAPVVRWPARPADDRPAWYRDVLASDPWADLPDRTGRRLGRTGPRPGYAPGVPHNDHIPGWDQLNAGPAATVAPSQATVVVISDDVPREYYVETWDPPHGPAEYASGVVVDRLAAIVTVLAHPERRMRITRVDRP